ncbi:MAG: hypothetical protein HEQ39_16180 [Rhizobacter sp.]
MARIPHCNGSKFAAFFADPKRNLIPSTIAWTHAVALVAMLFCLAGTAGAESSDATDAAFAALLSMPGAQPKEGGWVIPEQADAAPTTETELIARLRRMTKAGANVNAMRHGGTLLAHAIRADKQRTAIWLLRNGADPKRVLHHSEKTSTAYDLARQFKRNDVIKVLQSAYGFKPPTPHSKPAIGQNTLAPARPASLPSRRQEAIALINKIVPSHRQVSKVNQQEWQTFAATLSTEEYVDIFKDGTYLPELIYLQRDIDGGIENALSRLPLDLVRRHAQEIADILAERSHVEYGPESKMHYSVASQSWPALWSRIDKPLRYEKRYGLVEHISPALWPGLFASGYAMHDAEATGCLLSALDIAAFKALWPEFQRRFTDARQEAPALVLAKYRIESGPSPCYYSSSPAATVAKLAFLREQGVNSSVTGLRSSALKEQGDAALVAMAERFSAPATKVAPRLVLEPPTCNLALNDLWLDVLVNNQFHKEGRGPLEHIQAIAIPGKTKCGLGVSGDKLEGWPEREDDFFQGPFRTGSFNCQAIDSRQDGVVWFEDAGRLHSFSFDAVGSWPLRHVRDGKTGKRFMLSSGVTGPLCSPFSVLPVEYEWQTQPLKLTLVTATDGPVLDGLLRKQCKEVPETKEVFCEGIDLLAKRESNSEAQPQPTSERLIATLRQGGTVEIKPLVEVLGSKRRQAYSAAVAARDHAQVRQLLAAGIPTWWTAAEILSLGQADLALADKRRRIAVLFANADHLAQVLRAANKTVRAELVEASAYLGARPFDLGANGVCSVLLAALNAYRYDVPQSLLTWLPDQDWVPVWRVIQRDPSTWFTAAKSLRDEAHKRGRTVLACRVDHAQGFLCGGGINSD